MFNERYMTGAETEAKSKEALRRHFVEAGNEVAGEEAENLRVQAKNDENLAIKLSVGALPFALCKLASLVEGADQFISHNQSTTASLISSVLTTAAIWKGISAMNLGDRIKRIKEQVQLGIYKKEN